MNQMEWLRTLANKKYLTEKQFITLKSNKYVEEYSYFSSDINSEIYLLTISNEGWDRGFYDKRFLVNVIKNDFICECGGYLEYIENQVEDMDTMMLSCSKCENIIEKYRD